MFLGKCKNGSTEGIRYLVVSQPNNKIIISRYDAVDPEDANFCDIYSFFPLNEERQDGDADERIEFENFDECIAYLEEHFPGSSKKLVNEGVTEAEYIDYNIKANDREN